MTAPDLAIVIPTWNRADLLRTCLHSIAEHMGDLSLEVIVFDNGSDDATPGVVDEFKDALQVHLLRSEVNLGFAGACNRSVEASQAPVVLLLNNDATLTSPLSAGVAYFRAHPNVGVCQGPVLMMDGRRIDSVGSLLSESGFLRHLDIGRTVPPLPDDREVFSVKGVAMWIRRDVLDGQMPFDDDAFAYFEESDLCWRLLVNGWEVRYSKDLPAVVHLIGATSTKLPGTVCQFHSFKNRLRALLRYSENRSLLVRLPAHLFWCFASMCVFLVYGRFAEGMAVARGVAWNLKRLPTTVGERHQVSQARKVTDRELRSRVGTRMSPVEMWRQKRGGDEAAVIAQQIAETTIT